MRRGLNILLVGWFLVLGGCASQSDLLTRFAKPDPVPSSFFVCYGYGCKFSSHISLTQEEWLDVRAVFDPQAENAPAERGQVAAAVALLERLVGPRTGTWVHQRHSRWNYGDPTQLDCIDNSINTWTYLTMFAHDDLLHYHKVAGLAHRGTLFTLDFSNAAVLEQTDDGEQFTVDPWLAETGVPPPVYPLDMWLGP